MSELKRFSEFSEEPKLLDGEKLKLDNILGKEVTIINYRVGKSKFHSDQSYLTIQISVEDITYIVFTGSLVLENQLIKYNSQLPFIATIKKIKNYYTLT